MEENQHFKRLSSELSLEERQDLLKKLWEKSRMPQEPLYTEKDGVSEETVEIRYAKLPLLLRILYFIMSFFKSKPPVKIYEDAQVAALGRKIEQKAGPGIYNYQQNLLLSGFLSQMEQLKRAARFFYNALDVSVNRDKGVFYSFLGSLEMNTIHQRLEVQTDPKLLKPDNPGVKDAELRKIGLGLMEETLAAVTEDQRKAMYFNARTLNCLRELAAFQFDRVILAFSPDSQGGGQVCSAGLVRNLLMTLANILSSMTLNPPMTLLESLFVFLLQERTEDPDFDMEEETQKLLVQAETSLQGIREFNQKIPLPMILRCAARDMNYSPKPIGGGEDWFVVYRDYWKHRAETLFAEYYKERKRREEDQIFKTFLNGLEMIGMKNAASDANNDGFPLPEERILSFLLTFHEAVFRMEFDPVLEPILMEGEFLKKQNLTEFTESYTVLKNLADSINKLDEEMSPAGDFGVRYNQARQEMSSLPVKRRKVQIVVDDASAQAQRIIVRTKDAVVSMINLLGGILDRSNDGNYGALINISRLGDENFEGKLKTVWKKLTTAIQLLDGIGPAPVAE
jgi:hypothetical protein